MNFPGQETSGLFQMEDRFVFQEGRWNAGTQRALAGAPPATPAPPRRGFLVAWDPIAQKARWRLEFLPSGGMLSTAGNLVFVGDATGRFMALHAETGKTLWEQQTGAGYRNARGLPDRRHAVHRRALRHGKRPRLLVLPESGDVHRVVASRVMGG